MKEILWPTAGWLRAVTYWGWRVLRLQGTPHSIALGLAIGAAASVTPFVGLHFVLTILICWAAGGQIVAGIVGTLIGNPWTFPVIWMFTYRLGCVILGIDVGIQRDVEISFWGLVKSPFQAIAPMLGPMIVGSLPVAVATGWIVYIPARRLISDHQRRRADRLHAARQRRQAPLSQEKE